MQRLCGSDGRERTKYLGVKSVRDLYAIMRFFAGFAGMRRDLAGLAFVDFI